MFAAVGEREDTRAHARRGGEEQRRRRADGDARRLRRHKRSPTVGRDEVASDG